MYNPTGIIIDGIKWLIYPNGEIVPLCPKHYLRLELKFSSDYSSKLFCEECEEYYFLERGYNKETQYVFNKIDSKDFRNIKFINFDDEAVPLAKSKIKSKNNKYFITALLTQSRIGLRLVLYAGENGRKEKTQIFVEPEIKRLAFDQKDLHPTDIFLKLEGTFNDDSKMSIKKYEK